MNQLTKVEKKLLKAQQRDFKKKFNKVRSRIRKLKDIKTPDRNILIDDLSKVNLDLMGALLENGQFSDSSDYFDTVNAYCRSEMDCYDYGNTVLGYIPGKMFDLMEVIRNFHNNMDRLNELRSKIMRTDENSK